MALELVSLRDAGVPARDETGNTFHDKPRKRPPPAPGRAASDAGGRQRACVDALDGAPGVHSAALRAYRSERRSSCSAALEASHSRAEGAFLLRVALSAPDGGRVLRAEGRVDGSIALAPRGPTASDTIPLFLPASTPGKTLAELGRKRKIAFPSRRALQDLRAPLERLARGGAV